MDQTTKGTFREGMQVLGSSGVASLSNRVVLAVDGSTVLAELGDGLAINVDNELVSTAGAAKSAGAAEAVLAHAAAVSGQGVSIVKSGAVYYTYSAMRDGRWVEVRWAKTVTGQEFRPDEQRIVRAFRWLPLIGPDVTLTGGSSSRYAVITASPAIQPELSAGATVSRTVVIPSGGRELYLWAMGRTGGIRGCIVTIVPSDANAVIDWAGINLDIETTTATDQQPGAWLIGFLPEGTYTVSLTDGAYTSFYPVALGIADGQPYRKEHEQVRVMPMAVLWHANGSAFVDYTSTGANGSVTMGATDTLDPSLSEYLYVRAKAMFNRQDMTFTTANSGGGTWAGEYWNGTAWAPVTVIRNTMGQFATDGYVEWEMPSDWAATTVNGVSGFWLRQRATSVTSGMQIASIWLRTEWRAMQEVLDISNQRSEWLMVLNRDENPTGSGAPTDDVLGGHGNVGNPATKIEVDGKDVTALLETEPVVGSDIVFTQSCDAFENNDGTGAKVGSFFHTARLIPGMLLVSQTYTADETTTVKPWGYPGMIVADADAFTHMSWIRPGGEDLPVTIPASVISSKTDAAQTSIGVRYSSTAHPYSHGIVHRNPEIALWGRAHGEDPVVLRTSGSASKDRLKGYWSSSVSANPYVMSPGEKWVSEVAWFWY